LNNETFNGTPEIRFYPALHFRRIFFGQQENSYHTTRIWVSSPADTMGFPDKAQLILDRFADVEDRINQSTFGRVFRLDGSGHVCNTQAF
jgi:hypothetical protein